MPRIFSIIQHCFLFPLKVKGVSRKNIWEIFLLRTFTALAVFFAIPLLQKLLIDSIAKERIYAFMIYLAINFLVFSISEALIFLFTLKMFRVKNVITNELIKNSLYGLESNAQFTRRGRGGLASSRIYNESCFLSDCLDFTVGVYGNTLNVFLSISVCVFIDLRSLLVIAPAIIISLIAIPHPSRRQHVLTLETDRSRSVAVEKMNMHLMSYPSLRFLGIGKLLTMCVTEAFEQHLDADMKLKKDRAHVTFKSGMLFHFLEITVTGGVAFFVIAARLTIGSFFSITRSSLNTFSGIHDLNTRLVSLPVLYSRIRRYQKFTSKADVSRPHNLNNVSLDDNDVRALIDVALNYKDARLGEIRFLIGPGARLCIIGGNGAGKSSLLDKFLNLDSDVFYGRCNVTGAISYSPSVPVFPYLKGFEVLNNLLAGDLHEKSLGLLSELNVIHVLDQYPFEWSDGERRRFSIALCLLKHAGIYIFDEPLSSIDSGSHLNLIEIILRETSGAILIASFHNSEYAAKFTHHVFLDGAIRWKALA